jgi:fucose permease
MKQWLIRLQLLVMCLGFAFIGVQDGTLGVLLPSLQHHYALNAQSISSVFVALTSGYLVAALLTGPLVSRLGERRTLSAGAGVVMLGLAGIASAPPWALVLAALLGVGFGVAIIDAGLNTFVAALPNNEALLNYVHAIYGSGALISPLLASGLLATSGRWTQVYVLMAGLAALLVIGFVVSLRVQTPSVIPSPAAPAAQGNLFAATLSLPAVRLSSWFLLIYIGVEVTIGSWSFSYLREAREQPMMLAGWVATSYWLGLTLGRLAIGGLVRQFGSLRLIQLCLLGALGGLVALWALPGAVGVALALLWTGISIGPIFPTLIATLSHTVPARLLATTIGLITSLGALGGALFPWLAGTFANQLGVGILPPFVIVLLATLLLIWLAFQRSIQPESQRAASASPLPRMSVPSCRIPSRMEADG